MLFENFVHGAAGCEVGCFRIIPLYMSLVVAVCTLE